MMSNIADLQDPNDPKGRTINNAKEHKYSVGELVELENKARLFVTRLSRDCDGTPLYMLGCKLDRIDLLGISEEYITQIR